MMPALYAVLALLLVIDWRQTLRIARNPQRWYEMNPILGKHPSVAAVNVWFAVVCAAAVAAWFFAPAAWLLWLFGIGALAELICVANNFRLGLKP